MTLKRVDKKDKNIVELEIEVGKEKFEEAVRKAYKKNVAKINVPGFRHGKAPRKLIESMYGEGIFYDDAINFIYPDAYAKAVEEAGIDPVDHPSIDILDVSKEGFKFTATVTISPEVTLKKYKGLEVERISSSVSDKDIDEEIEYIRARNARLETVSRPVQNGDTAVIDFEGFIDGVAFEGGKDEKYSIVIGSGKFIPGFEEQLVGMKENENRDINVTFPENYGEKSVAGKAAVFKVFLHEVKESILPELDDEFAKDVSEFDTLEEYRKSLASDLELKRKAKADEMLENSLVIALTENVEADIPEVMFTRQIQKMNEEFSYRLASQGINMNQYMKMMNIKEEDMAENFREQAIREVKTSLALTEIVKKENFDVTPEELTAEYERLSAQYSMPVEKVKEFLDEKALKYDLCNMKAMYFIRDNAIIKDYEPGVKKGSEADKAGAQASEKPAKAAKAAKAEKSGAEDGKAKKPVKSQKAAGDKSETVKTEKAVKKSAAANEKNEDGEEKPKKKTVKKKETT